MPGELSSGRVNVKGRLSAHPKINIANEPHALKNTHSIDSASTLMKLGVFTVFPTNFREEGAQNG
jgi:hypothetical protein